VWIPETDTADTVDLATEFAEYFSQEGKFQEVHLLSMTGVLGDAVTASVSVNTDELAFIKTSADDTPVDWERAAGSVVGSFYDDVDNDFNTQTITFELDGTQSSDNKLIVHLLLKEG
jgi:hypothetical protein